MLSSFDPNVVEDLEEISNENVWSILQLPMNVSLKESNNLEETSFSSTQHHINNNLYNTSLNSSWSVLETSNTSAFFTPQLMSPSECPSNDSVLPLFSSSYGNSNNSYLFADKFINKNSYLSTPSCTEYTPFLSSSPLSNMNMLYHNGHNQSDSLISSALMSSSTINNAINSFNGNNDNNGSLNNQLRMNNGKSMSYIMNSNNELNNLHIINNDKIHQIYNNSNDDNNINDNSILNKKKQKRKEKKLNNEINPKSINIIKGDQSIGYRMILEEPIQKVSVSCHQCKNKKKLESVIICGHCFAHNNIMKTCTKKFCKSCLLKFYLESPNADVSDPAWPCWRCPCCRFICCCAWCRQKKAKRIEHVEKLIKFNAHRLTPAISLARKLVYQLDTGEDNLLQHHSLNILNCIDIIGQYCDNNNRNDDVNNNDMSN